MFNQSVKKSGKERGNALFLILIAVALFAALSYAVTQSGRGSGTVDKETALIAAAQTTQYPAALRSTITRMVITGTATTAIDFTTGNGTAKVFGSSGGNAVFQTPPNNIGTASGEGQAMGGTLTASTWGFKDVSHANRGYFVLGVGTDAGVGGREILAYLHDITLAVCEQINKGLGLTTTPETQSTAVDLTLNSGKGADATAADASAAAAGTGTTNVYAASNSSGRAFACIRNGATLYDYYHALVEQ